MGKRIVLASGNAGKLAEFSQLLAPLAIEVIPQGQLGVTDVAETGLTFVENAIIKARHASQVTGLPALADDSGLEVDALQGAPGIYSARFAGEPRSDQANNAKLLAALEGVAAAQRSARYRCVLVYLRHSNDPTPLICQGTLNGQIGLAAQGEQGFGYDPIFVLDNQQSAAQLSAQEKHRISHRGQAVRQLLAQLPDYLA